MKRPASAAKISSALEVPFLIGSMTVGKTRRIYLVSSHTDVRPDITPVAWRQPSSYVYCMIKFSPSEQRCALPYKSHFHIGNSPLELKMTRHVSGRGCIDATRNGAAR